jgi:hypothetical protein
MMTVRQLIPIPSGGSICHANSAAAPAMTQFPGRESKVAIQPPISVKLSSSTQR